MQEQLRAELADRYEFQEEVGRGAMATIYRVHDRKHDRAVAVKVLDPVLAATMGPTRFLREIKLAAGLQHPHILPVYDSGETAGFLWFTMPYVDGESLRDLLIREQQLKPERALAIAAEVAEALDYAHRRGVLHRDVKPDNIMLTEGHALVADFGVARPADLSSDLQITGPGLVVGTPAYMAPEQAMGDPIDARCDLYSLGMVIYEMLAGNLPMPETTSELLEVKRLSGERVMLPSLGPGIPGSVKKVVQKALAPSREQRYQTGAEFSLALRRVLAAMKPSGSGAGTMLIRARSPRVLAIGMVLLLASIGLFAWQGRPAPGVVTSKRIAVLPFVNLNQAGDEYFAEGITDDIRGKLAALPGMQVTPRSSSVQSSAGPLRPQQIGRELDVEYLLTGTVRWDRNEGESRVQVRPELIQTSTGSTLWQQSFEAPLNDVFQVQGDIAGQVALALDVALAVRERERLAEGPTRDLAAYDLFLRGRHAFLRRTADGLNEARQLFEQAITQDPQFARAYAGLAEVYVVLPFWVDVPPSQTHPRAIAAATEALRLDSTLGEAHAALADARALYEWNWSAAEQGFRRALALDPGNANTHHWYGQDYLIVVGRYDEAIREGRSARQLDPLAPVYGTTLAQTLASSRRYDEALALADGIMAVEPSFSMVHETRGRVLLHTGKYQLAVDALEKNLQLTGRNAVALALLGYAYTRVNRSADAGRILRELEAARQRGYTSGTALAILHAGLGNITQAFQWLDTALKEQDPFLVYFFVVDPILQGLRKDQRGKALLAKMNLPSTP